VRKPHLDNADPKPFMISPANLEGARLKSSIPNFKVSGTLHRQSCFVNLPFTGDVVIEASEADITSVELQLVRVESISRSLGGGSVSASSGGGSEGGDFARECTEVESIQIGAGDVTRGVVIPIYMIFPRIYTTPTLTTAQFKVEFEVNLIIIFADGYQVTENFPITLHRTQ
jgi:hypothetical protein